MRDYSFGNFISALRERCGLSQYQLGALVGVSDKAVSKWENGASKPRINTIKRLSEVLDVSIDELLTCEYTTFNNERKDLFAMKNEIIKIAKNKLREFYGDNLPTIISNRFKTEELMLDGQETLLWMGFFGKLQEKFYEENAYFVIRCAQMGASYIAWLLGGTNVNPLPAHYYCPVCKKVEFCFEEKCGIDLPDKICACGNKFHKDGFGIDSFNMYPLAKWNEINVSNNGTNLVKKCLKEYFEGYGEIREITIIGEERPESNLEEKILITRLGLFSKEQAKGLPEEMISLSAEKYYGMHDEISTLTIIENVEEQMCSRDLLNMNFSAQCMKEYFKYAVASGKYENKYQDMKLEKVISNIETPSFSDLLALSGFLHSTGAWKGNAEVLYDNGIPLKELISCREDLYAYLYNKLNGRCCDNPSGQVFEIKEAVRKGKYSNNRMPAEIEKLLLACEIPKWYVESMKKILYLFPKTYLIVMLKRDICKFMMSNN